MTDSYFKSNLNNSSNDSMGQNQKLSRIETFPIELAIEGRPNVELNDLNSNFFKDNSDQTNVNNNLDSVSQMSVEITASSADGTVSVAA